MGKARNELQKIAEALGEPDDPFAAWERLHCVIEALEWYANPRVHTTVPIAEAEKLSANGLTYSKITRPCELVAEAMDGYAAPVILTDSGDRARKVLLSMPRSLTPKDTPHET